MRYFIVFSYVGTSFHGSQTQPNGITVQETMEQAFATICRQPVALTFAGRTDAGVHAEMMVAHFDYADALPENLLGRLNNLLPTSIALQQLYPVTDTMHARFSAIARTYEYRVVDHKAPFLESRATRVPVGLDYDAMNKAAALLMGKHDFASFCRVHTDVKTTFCTISRAQWEYNNNLDGYVFTIQADRFLRNMVRAIVGTLFLVGKHRLSLEDFAAIIDAKNRCAAGESAPAEGLYLTHIDYPA